MLKRMFPMVGLLMAILFLYAAPSFAEPRFGLLGAPYNTWGEVSQGFGSVPRAGLNEGLKFDTRIEQGLEIARFGPQDRFRLVPFVALRLTVSDQPQDVWNNQFGQELGIKVKYLVPVGEGHWGEIALGVKGVHRQQFQGADDIGGIVFLQYGFGGDWMHKK